MSPPDGCCEPPARPCPEADGHPVDEERLAAAATLAQALADPIRLAMLEMMVQGRACCELPAPGKRGVPGSRDPIGICVCEFQERFDLAQSKASYHLRVLREAGLIRTEARGKWTFHSLDREAADMALRALQEVLGSAGPAAEGASSGRREATCGRPASASS